MRCEKGRRGGQGLTSDLWFEGRSMRFTPVNEMEDQTQKYIDQMNNMF